MSRTARILIFIGTIILTFIGLLALQTLGNQNGQHYPKWPAIVVVMAAYFLLFPKKKKQSE